uniref:BTB/POZ domain-containing protein n=1 Tax=Aegilops tauschii TaxID=37682 RepID=R7W5I1_AEGTA
MTEEHSEDNLAARTEAYLSQSVLRHPGEATKALKSCEELLPHAEELGIAARCVDAIAARSSATSLSWFGDLAVLGLHMYKRVMAAMAAREDVGPGALEGCLVSHAHATPPGLPGVATVEDVLIPSYSGVAEMLYDVDYVEWVVRHFLAEEEVGEDEASWSAAITEEEAAARTTTSRPSAVAMVQVGKLVDNYLADLASDANLKPTKFCELALAMPDHARIYDDGVYRAVDIYLKAHPRLTAEERNRVCGVVDCRKLTMEACTHAAQNERLLLRAVLQLFGPMMENDAKSIQIDDMEAKVFKMMLHFIYTDTLPNIDEGEIVEMAQHLFVAADRYNLERLKLICANMLCNYMDVSTVATTLALAEQHDCDRLKEVCYRFLASFQNLKAVTLTDGFKHLKIIRPNILEELLGR